MKSGLEGRVEESRSQIKKLFKKFDCHIDYKGSKEQFSCKYAGGVVNFKASSIESAIYGMGNIRTSLISGHFGEIIGEYAPNFYLRPLWVPADVTSSSIPLPKQFFKFDTVEKQKELATHLIEMGYNALVFGAVEPVKDDTESSFPLLSFLQTLSECGITSIIKPEHEGFCPLSQEAKEFYTDTFQSLAESVPKNSYVLWESGLHIGSFKQDPLAKDALLSDLVRQEALALEKQLPEKIKLIYYIPCDSVFEAEQQAEWIPNLLDEVGKNVTIAFSATAGSLVDDQNPLHPIWNILRECPDISHTPLLPLANIGGIGKGEGRWPSLPVDFIQSIYSRCYRHKFAGLGVLTPCIPRKESLLGCSLWSTGQGMWQNKSPGLFIETWFKAYRPKWKYQKWFPLFDEVRKLSCKLELSLSFLTQQQAEHLSSRLQFLEIEVEREEISLEPSLYPYFQIFLKEARVKLQESMQKAQLSSSNLLEEGEIEEQEVNISVEYSG